MLGNLYFGNSADTYADRRLTLSADVKAKGSIGQQAIWGHH